MSFRLVTLFLSICFLFAGASYGSEGKITASQKNQIHSGAFIEIDGYNFKTSEDSIFSHKTSDFLNPIGPHITIKNLKLLVATGDQNPLAREPEEGFLVNASDAIVLDEICSQLTEGEYAYFSPFASSFIAEKVFHDRQSAVSIYTDRGGFLTVDFSVIAQSTEDETIKNLVCMKNS